jgi:hypothetical protein
MGPGEYTFENAAGAVGTMSIPGAPDPEIEKLRVFVDGAPVTYLMVKVDNSKGTAAVNMDGVSIITPGGQELKYVSAASYLDELRPVGAEAELYNTFIKLANRLKAEAKPLMVKDFVLIGPAVPEVISGVKVYTTGLSDPVDALPVR